MLNASEKEQLLRYMKDTCQTKLLLIVNNQYMMAERKDGATNNEQESGYHDYLVLTGLPLPIRLEFLKT